MKCPNCDSRDIDFQEAGGQSICMSCGTVVEENTIVSSIEFQETGDRSHVIGQFVAANCAKPFMSSSRMMGRHVDNKDSKEVSLLNARRIISHIVSQMRLPPPYSDRAHRLYQIAITREVNGGRKQSYLVAACLYVVCRQDKSPHLLIDFSDALQVNVYSLGKAFLRLYRVINIPLDVIDPSLYLHRYADKIVEYGERKHAVILTALRVITRLKKDWIVVGRRPDGVCAAALLIASRAHEFDISQESIANLFHISYETVRKRIMEFRNTPAAQLTLHEFYALEDELQLEFDPPAFIKNQLEENETVELCLGDYAIPPEEEEEEESPSDSDDDEEEEETAQKGFEVSDLARDKVYADDDNSDFEPQDSDSDSEKSFTLGTAKKTQKKVGKVVVQQRSAFQAPSCSKKKVERSRNMAVGGVTIHVPFPNTTLATNRKGNGMTSLKSRDQSRLYREIYEEFHIPFEGSANTDEGDNSDSGDFDEETDEEEVADFYKKKNKKTNLLQERHLIIKLDMILHPTSCTPSSSSSSAAARKNHTTTYSTLNSTLQSSYCPQEDAGDDGLIPDEFQDDDEVRNCLFNDDEKAKRTALFNTTYGPFLEERERRRSAREGEANADSDRYTQTGKLRKKYQRQLVKGEGGAGGGGERTEDGDGEPAVKTAASQAMSTAKATIKAASKKINYEALQGVFDDNGSFAMPLPRSSSRGHHHSVSVSARLQERELAALSGAAAASLFMQQQLQGYGSSSFDDTSLDHTPSAGGNKRKREKHKVKVTLGGGLANKTVKKEETVILPATQAVQAAKQHQDVVDVVEMDVGGYYEEEDFDYEDQHDVVDDYDD